MSCWVVAEVAANIVVVAPIMRQVVIALLSRVGCSRMRRKIPATTIVLECRRAETGVGPSMAEGNHGWRRNCADFPIAAVIRPTIGSALVFCWRSS